LLNFALLYEDMIIVRLFRYGIYSSLTAGGTLIALDSYRSNGLDSSGFVRFGRTTLAVDFSFFFMK
jgi:hypothetical protein